MYNYTSNVSHDVGKIFQSQLAFSVELTAIQLSINQDASKRALKT